MALYVNQRFTYTLRAVQSKVIKHIFECVTVELDMKKTQKYNCELCLRNTGVRHRPIL